MIEPELTGSGLRLPATDYPLTLTAARHIRERLALAIAEAEQLAVGVGTAPEEPRVPRRAPELPAVISAHA